MVLSQIDTWFIPLLLFILVAGFTPGPNNIIAMSIGFSWGFKKVIPHILGVAIGFPIMLLLIGFILEPIFKQYTVIFLILKWLSLAYIIYLAYKIATAPLSIKEDKTTKPISFIESVIFQWINPKAWAGAMATVTLYVPQNNYSFGLIVASITSAITIIFAISFWGYMGKKIKIFLSKQSHIKAFNYTMAFMLIVSVIAML